MMGFKWVSFVLLFAFVVSCGTKFDDEIAIEEAVENGQNGSTDVTTGTAVDGDFSAFQLSVEVETPDNFYMHKASSDMSASCSIPKARLTTAAFNDENNILCYLEAEELDLHYNGFGIKIDVPKGYCDYTEFRPFWFYQFQPGNTYDNGSYKSYEIVDDVCGEFPTACDGQTYTDPSSDTPKACINKAAAGLDEIQWTYSYTSELHPEYPNCDEGSLQENIFGIEAEQEDATFAFKVGAGGSETRATLSLGGAGSDDITYTAVTAGATGNSISIQYVAGGVQGSEVVTVTDQAIEVQIADGASTADEVVAAISSNSAATALVKAVSNNSTEVQSAMGAASNLTGGGANVECLESGDVPCNYSAPDTDPASTNDSYLLLPGGEYYVRYTYDGRLAAEPAMTGDVASLTEISVTLDIEDGQTAICTKTATAINAGSGGTLSASCTNPPNLVVTDVVDVAENTADAAPGLFGLLSAAVELSRDGICRATEPYSFELTFNDAAGGDGATPCPVTGANCNYAAASSFASNDNYIVLPGKENYVIFFVYNNSTPRYPALSNAQFIRVDINNLDTAADVCDAVRSKITDMSAEIGFSTDASCTGSTLTIRDNQKLVDDLNYPAYIQGFGDSVTFGIPYGGVIRTVDPVKSPGKHGNCVAGAITMSDFEQDDQTMYYKNRQYAEPEGGSAYSETWTFTSPFDMDKQFTNLSLANFTSKIGCYSDDYKFEHAALWEVSRQSSEIDSADGLNDFRRGPFGRGIVGTSEEFNWKERPHPQPMYEVICLDEAKEVKGRIRLLVRDWDVSPVAGAWAFSNVGAVNPNGGTGYMDNSLTQGGTPLNDYYDWDDFYRLTTFDETNFGVDSCTNIPAGRLPTELPSAGTGQQIFTFPSGAL